ncbi:uncharacterized protein VTP21DRAFT_10362 [Calcarisporiella thermophila]|uniref:uncharacterized protein n=1 Tax=Calcarisporiella thermophila TaxID=911321 RepID=UPI0037442009
MEDDWLIIPKENAERVKHVFSRHLGSQVTTIEKIYAGSFSEVFLVTCASGQEYIARICRSQDGWRTENQVACLSLISKHTTIAVPRVLHWCVDTSEIGAEYIIMTKIPGERLEQHWYSLAPDSKQKLLAQLADWVVQLKRIPVERIGVFGFDSEGQVRIRTLSEVMFLFLKGGRGEEEQFESVRRYVEAHAQEFGGVPAEKGGDLIAQIDRLMERVFQAQGGGEAPVMLCHNDLSETNIMVEGDRLTGLLDFEFSGAFPADVEAFGSFEFLDTELPWDHPPVPAEGEIASLKEYFRQEVDRLDPAVAKYLFTKERIFVSEFILEFLISPAYDQQQRRAACRLWRDHFKVT